MTTLTAADRDRDWAAYEAGYEAAYKQAVDEKVCFCRCGCTLPVESLNAWGGPARCEACKKGDQHKHSLMPRPVETFDWAKYEPAPKPKATRPRNPPVSWAKRHEAEAYVRKAGHNGFKAIRRMRERLVEAHMSLTPTQTEAALRSKAADERAEVTAVKRSEQAERRASRKTDINRVVIGDSVAEGDYAVRDDDGWFVRINVKRPRTGPMHGFVMLTLTFGDGIEKPGQQYPGPGQTYRGEGAHLVARLVADPEAAKALYQLAKEEEAA
jgi:hypothetical protein